MLLYFQCAAPIRIPVAPKSTVMPTEQLAEKPLETEEARIFLGRQPIYDAERNVCAYELLYRDGGAARGAMVDDAHAATAQVVVNYLLELGVGEVTRGKPAFVNFSREGLEGELVGLLPAADVVIEVLEDVQPDAALVARVQELSERGFQIALDDFIYHPKWEPLLRIADIVKVELMDRTDMQVRNTVRKLRRHDVRLLAEKVETHEQFEKCRELGFEMFQGYFLCRPEMLSGARLPANRLALFELVAKTQQVDVNVNDIEDLLKRDAYLSVRLLRMVNSAHYALPSEVSSIRQAIVLLGLERLSCLAATLMLTRVDDKPPEIVRTATCRAYFCESLARATGKSQVGMFFLTGLCSTLDALFDRPLDAIFASVPLDEEIARGVMKHEGSCGAALKAALAYEIGDWERARFENLEEWRLSRIYWDALRQTDEIMAVLKD